MALVPLVLHRDWGGLVTTVQHGHSWSVAGWEDIVPIRLRVQATLFISSCVAALSPVNYRVNYRVVDGWVY